ncbi:MAG: DUF3014 domain-containing protein [Woeseiaceae bacterium]|nr:DUF3014 domain-containing protein [Woeseiaceae bacterium]
MQTRRTEWLIPVLLALGAAAALWYYWIQVNKTPPAPAPEVPVQEQSRAEPEPVHPLQEPAPRSAERGELVPLPPLDQSDDYFRLEMSELAGDAIGELLVESGLIERIVATVDNLPRDHVAERIRPLQRLGGQFIVEPQDGDDAYLLTEANFERYTPLVDLVEGADLHSAGELYRRFYPLFQKAYVDLGYPQGYFNDRLVEVIDHLLSTPDVDDAVALVRPHVLYEYADPELEELSSGQKLLIRMGSRNRSRVKQTLREFRGIITSL